LDFHFVGNRKSILPLRHTAWWYCSESTLEDWILRRGQKYLDDGEGYGAEYCSERSFQRDLEYAKTVDFDFDCNIGPKKFRMIQVTRFADLTTIKKRIKKYPTLVQTNDETLANCFNL
jgi:hypothetical protein